MTTKENLIEYIQSDYMTDEMIELLYSIVSLNKYPNMGELRKLAGISDDDWRKMDSATPIDYRRQVEQVYPNFNKGCMVFDYTSKTFGEFTNLNDIIVSRIIKTAIL